MILFLRQLRRENDLTLKSKPFNILPGSNQVNTAKLNIKLGASDQAPVVEVEVSTLWNVKKLKEAIVIKDLIKKSTIFTGNNFLHKDF